MRRGNNYSGARWAFRAHTSGDNLRALTATGTARPLCPSCGRGYVIRRGTQRCFTLPGDRRCERDTSMTTGASSPRPGRAVVAHLGIACALIGAVTSCSPSSPRADATPAAAVSATVLRAVDGDTLDVRDDTRGRLRVRLLGIDSPEVHKPGWSVGCWGPEAAQFTADSLTGQRIALVTDPGQDSHDRYGRTYLH